MEDKTGGKYLFNRKYTMQEAAHIGIKHLDFKITEKISKKDFINIEHYNSFMNRVKELKLV